MDKGPKIVRRTTKFWQIFAKFANWQVRWEKDSCSTKRAVGLLRSSALHEKPNSSFGASRMSLTSAVGSWGTGRLDGDGGSFVFLHDTSPTLFSFFSLQKISIALEFLNFWTNLQNTLPSGNNIGSPAIPAKPQKEIWRKRTLHVNLTIFSLVLLYTKV